MYQNLWPTLYITMFYFLKNFTQKFTQHVTYELDTAPKLIFYLTITNLAYDQHFYLL